MATPIVVVGHQNPDNDSICSAIAYAYLKNELEKQRLARDRRSGRRRTCAGRAQAQGR